MEDFAVTCPLVPSVPHLVSGSCSSPRACGLGFLQTPPRSGCPCPSPRLRLREYLARGLTPRSFCALPGTHASAHRRGAVCRVRWSALLGTADASAYRHRADDESSFGTEYDASSLHA